MNSRTERIDFQIEQQSSEIRAFFGDNIPLTDLNKCKRATRSGERDDEEENEIGLPTLELTYIILFGYRSRSRTTDHSYTLHTYTLSNEFLFASANTRAPFASHACYLLFCVRCFFVLFLHFSILILRCWLLFFLLHFISYGNIFTTMKQRKMYVSISFTLRVTQQSVDV